MVLNRVQLHCVKSARIRGFSGPHFSMYFYPHSVSLRIQSECGKMRTRKTPNTTTFHAVLDIVVPLIFHQNLRF